MGRENVDARCACMHVCLLICQDNVDLCMYGWMDACMHPSIHPCVYPDVRTFVHACMHSYIHSYTYTYMRTYMETCLNVDAGGEVMVLRSSPVCRFRNVDKYLSI